jgi:hypothetical protein
VGAGFGLVLLLFSKANKSFGFQNFYVFFISLCVDGFDSWVLSRLFVSFWHLGGGFLHWLLSLQILKHFFVNFVCKLL